MSSLQEIIYAEEWLNLAISKNKLGDFIIGIPPYAKTRINQGGIQEPILEPNLECLYSYYEDNPSTNFDKVVENELYKVISERGNNDFIIYAVLMFINMQLEHEKTNRAKFELNCSGLLSAVREQIKNNKDKFQTKSPTFEDGVWPEIEFYDNHMSEHYNQRVL